MRRFGLVGAVLGLLSVAGGCAMFPVPITPTSPGNPDAKAPLRQQFDRNLATWAASGITRYAFWYRPVCFCDTTPHLVVADGDAIRVDGVRPVDRGAAPVGVPGLFDLVRRAIDGDEVMVAYDPITGVPISMTSDPIANAVDDELDFTVTDWTLDPPDDRRLGSVTVARRLWDAQQLGSYRWSIAVDCDCVYDGGRFDIRVTDGEPTVRSHGTSVAVERLDGLPLTVPALFEQATLGALWPRSAFAFDRRRGYPTRVELRDDRPDAVSFMVLTVESFAVF